MSVCESCPAAGTQGRMAQVWLMQVTELDKEEEQNRWQLKGEA